MILKEDLKRIVQSQKEAIFHADRGIQRERLSEISGGSSHALIIAGIRRCGKSTLLLQLIRRHKAYHYFNFEDPRAGAFTIADAEKLEEAFEEAAGKAEHYFFDEIQSIREWERLVRFLLDRKKQVILTGSNASLLSRELGTKPSGRHLSYELFPFSYGEMLSFTKKKAGIESFQEYMEQGGFPDFLKSRNPLMLQQLFTDILARDIIVRYQIRNSEEVRNLALYLLTNSARQFSYNGLAKASGIKSVNSVLDYVSYFADSYFLFTIPRFSFSLKRQRANPRKNYTIDTGFARNNSVGFSEDKGRMLENLVFLQLRRHYKEIFYFQERGECDFLVKERESITQAYQACYQLTEENKEREVNGLIEAMDACSLKKGMILTLNQDDKIKAKGKEIVVRPTWEWI